jgi:alpha-methylacyl-CoA racemase
VSEILWNDEAIQPIQHLKVVDLSVMLTGPYLTRILAQYGAEVIKVEKGPAGDPCREAQYSAVFDLLNQGKKSICLDLTRPEAIEMVKSLVAEADIFVENFRSGVMDKLGLSYADLSEHNPDLIYLSLRGMSDKYSVKSGHDLNFIATSGCGEWFLEYGANYSSQFGDIVGGVLTPLTKLLIHLANPNRRGMHLVTYADEGFRSLYLPRAYELLEKESAEEENKKDFEAFPKFNGSFPSSRFYRCRDGQWISLQAIQKKHWDQFCEVTDKEKWKGRFQDLTLVPEIEALFQDAPAAYWEALSGKTESCLFRVIPWEEFLQLSQSRMKLNTDPLTWAGFAPSPKLPSCPSLGQDSFSVAHGLGYSNEKIGELMAKNVLTQKNKI